MKDQKFLQWITGLVFIILIFLIGHYTPRENFQQLSILFTGAFGVFVYWYRSDWFQDERWIYGMSIVSRLVLLSTVPLLSDDYFRFIWDGQLLVEGINPFSFKPSDMMDGGTMDIFQGLNSKDYFSVYPPVMQAIFGLSSFLSFGNIQVNLIILQSILLLADLGVVYFAMKILKRLGSNLKPVIIYALNPLVIIETVGNLHFEGLMMFFTLWALYLLMKWRGGLAAIIPIALVFSLGVVTKIVCVLYVPILVKKIGFKPTLVLGSAILIFVGISFLPFVDSQTIANFSDSLDLYFRKFEFNASLYFLSNLIYQKMVGWQEIKYVGPALALLNVVVILLVAFGKKVHQWERYFYWVLVVLTTHLLLSTTVHPWYLINLLVASIFIQKRYVVVWSWSIIVSYFFYQHYQLPLGLLLFEYTLMLGYMLFESKWRGIRLQELK